MTSEQLDDEDEGGHVPRELHLPRIFVGRPTPAFWLLVGGIGALLLVSLAKWALK